MRRLQIISMHGRVLAQYKLLRTVLRLFNLNVSMGIALSRQSMIS